jgi:hypothetical protein
MSERHPLWQQADKLQMDWKDLGARIIEFRAHLATYISEDSQPIERAKLTCPDCPATAFTPGAMEQHRYLHHDGPLPEIYAIADQRASDETVNS